MGSEAVAFHGSSGTVSETSGDTPQSLSSSNTSPSPELGGRYVGWCGDDFKTGPRCIGRLRTLADFSACDTCLELQYLNDDIVVSRS